MNAYLVLSIFVGVLFAFGYVIYRIGKNLPK